MKNSFERGTRIVSQYELSPSEAAQYLAFNEVIQDAVREFEQFLDSLFVRQRTTDDRNLITQKESEFRELLQKEGVTLKTTKDKNGVDVTLEEFVREYTFHRNS